MPYFYWITCHCCGKVFEAKRKDARWCDAVCRKRWHRVRTGTRMHRSNKHKFFKKEYASTVPIKELRGYPKV